MAKSVDPQTVLSAYEESGNVRAAAHRIGIHPQTASKYLHNAGIKIPRGGQNKRASDEDIVTAYTTFGPRRGASSLGIGLRTMEKRVQRIEMKTIGLLQAPSPGLRQQVFGLANHPGRIDVEISDGIGLVGSDAHIWPGDRTPAMNAFLFMISFLKEDLSFVCLNGDVIDASAISRFPSIGWETEPTVAEELGAGQAILREIRRIGGEEIDYFWTLGNHDGRFETRIATLTPELAGVHGVHLKDHFPDWEPCWSVWVNNDVCIKHRFRNGIHATWNNTVNAGTTMVTGHLHSLRVTPFSDYNGTRWGVDTGTLAAPYGPQFIHYTEANPVNWRAGGAVLTWNNGRLLWPELFAVIDEHHFEFRGRVYEV